MILCAYSFAVVAIFAHNNLICVGALIACAGCLAMHWFKDRPGAAPSARRGARVVLSPEPRAPRPHSHPVYGMSDDDAYRVDPTGDLG